MNDHIHPHHAVGKSLGDPILAIDIGLVVSKQAVPVSCVAVVCMCGVCTRI